MMVVAFNFPSPVYVSLYNNLSSRFEGIRNNPSVINSDPGLVVLVILNDKL